MSRVKEPARRGRYIGSGKWALGRALGLVLAGLALVAAAEPTPTPPGSARRAALTQLVLHDCGSCHGLTLKGGLGPALTPTALAGKAPEWLRATILDGRPGTPMPPWRGYLTEAEADWLVRALQRGELIAEK